MRFQWQTKWLNKKTCVLYKDHIIYFVWIQWSYTAQKLKFSIKDFFSECDHFRSFLQIWLHLLKKSLMENFTVCAVLQPFCCLWNLINWVVILQNCTLLENVLVQTSQNLHITYLGYAKHLYFLLQFEELENVICISTMSICSSCIMFFSEKM